MISEWSLPHGQVLLDGMAITSERLKTTSKVAVSLPVLRAIISAAVSEVPFQPDFYQSTYPDIRQAYEAGQISDLRAHFVETGYFEGRLGAAPNFDAQFYRSSNPDVAEALAKGATESAFDRNVRAGAFEGWDASAIQSGSGQRWTMPLYRTCGTANLRHGGQAFPNESSVGATLRYCQRQLRSYV